MYCTLYSRTPPHQPWSTSTKQLSIPSWWSPRSLDLLGLWGSYSFLIDGLGFCFILLYPPVSGCCISISRSIPDSESSSLESPSVLWVFHITLISPGPSTLKSALGQSPLQPIHVPWSQLFNVSMPKMSSWEDPKPRTLVTMKGTHLGSFSFHDQWYMYKAKHGVSTLSWCANLDTTFCSFSDISWLLYVARISCAKSSRDCTIASSLVQICLPISSSLGEYPDRLGFLGIVLKIPGEFLLQ